MSDTQGREVTRTKITAPQDPKMWADITVYPSEVVLDLDLGRDNSLTPAQAIELGTALLAAAAEAQSIEWVEPLGESLDVRAKR